MSLWFVKQSAIVATPSDSNDGKDPFGFNLSAATWTASSKTLVKAGAFSSYSWVSGDPIWISSATAGTDGWYEIASKDSDDQLTLGDLIEGTGIATDQTDVTSSDGPFLTISHAIDEDNSTGNTALSGGDEIRLCNDATWQPGNINWMHAGDSDNTIRLVGYSARGSSKELATIQATASGQWEDSAGYHVYELLDFDLNGQNYFINPDGENQFFISCKFHDGTSVWAVRADRDNQSFIDCECYGQLWDGLMAAGGADNMLLKGCSIHDNGNRGTGFRFRVVDCVIYNNGGYGIVTNSNTDNEDITGNTIYGNTGDGIAISSGAEPSVIVNNSISNNGGYGINFTGGTKNYILCDYNHYYNNTSGETNLSETPGDNNQSGDPLFTSVVDGSEDFTPKDGSPLIDNGLAAGGESGDIGALKGASAAGGSGAPRIGSSLIHFGSVS